MPLTPIYQTALDGTAFSGTIRPNYTGAPLYAAPPGYFLNLAAFAAPVGTFGNAGRNILDAPGHKNVDLGLYREFRIREKMQLHFRAELTNALNIVNLTDPVATMSSALFGTARTARAIVRRRTLREKHSMI